MAETRRETQFQQTPSLCSVCSQRIRWGDSERREWV